MIRGCPQGSSFGPMLWNIFQNDMAFHVKNSNLSMYADDHQLYITGRNIQEAKKKLEAEAKVAMSWYSDSFLLANPDKFQAITIKSRGQSTDGSERDITLDINGYTVQSTGHTNYRQKPSKADKNRQKPTKDVKRPTKTVKKSGSY